MKLFTNKKIIQKMTIVLVILMLFNFISPYYVRAADEETIGDKIIVGIQELALAVGDGVINLFQNIFIGTDAVLTKEEQMKLDGYQTVTEVVIENIEEEKVEWYEIFLPGLGALIDLIDFGFDLATDINEVKTKEGTYKDIYQIQISPGKIFSGVIYALNIDFISPKDSKVEEQNPEWYKKYTQAMEYLEGKINEYKGKDSLNENEENMLFGLTYVYLYFKAESEAEVVSKIRIWYNEMNNSFSEEAFYSVIAPNAAFDSTPELISKRTCICSAISESGLLEAVAMVGTSEDGFENALSWAANKSNSPANVLHDVIATWYKIMRNIALVFLLSILVYVGIRIMISSTAAENAKYKKMIVDWVVAICILFVLHYIMAFVINITQLIADAFTSSDITPQTVDEIITNVRIQAAGNSSQKFGYVILYLALVIYTAIFLVYYVKRVVYIAFLTLISPFVAITYPLDKMGDSKSQAFDMWLREYMLNVIIQPVHLIIYTVMVTSALTLAVNNPLYAIVVIGAMIPAEKFIKEMFGLSSKKGPDGGFAAGALAMNAINKLASGKPPKFGHHQGGNEKGGGDKTQPKEKKPRMAEDKTAEFSEAWTPKTQESRETENNNTITGTEIENNDNIDNGDFDSPNMNVLDKETEQSLEYNPYEVPLEFKQDEENGIDDNLLNYAKYDLENNVSDNEDKTTFEQMKDSNFSEQTLDFTGRTKLQLPNEKTTMPSVPNNSIPQEDTKSDKEKAKMEKRKLALRKKAARRAVNQHYRGRDIRMLKNIGRGALKVGLGAVAAGTAATIGLAAGIASGDPTKAWQYSAGGVLAGAKIGGNIGDGVANLAGGTVDFVKREKEAKEIYNQELYKNDKEYQKQQLAKESKKYARSADTKAAIRAHFGYNFKDKEDMDKAISAVERYRNNGINDLDTILNCYGLELGRDSEGNKVEELDPEKAMLVGLMAQKYDVDNESARKSAKSALKLQLAENIYNNSDGEISKAEAVSQGKQKASEVMKYVDMAQGMSIKYAGRADNQEKLQDAKDDEKREQQYREQAEMQARVNAEIKAKQEAERIKKAEHLKEKQEIEKSAIEQKRKEINNRPL